MSDFQQDLEQALGARVSFDAELCSAYDHDLGELPALLMAQVRSRPEAVAVPRTPAEVGQALVIAARHGVPVTPRAQGTSGYGGAIPTRGGLALDLCGLDRVLAVDAAGLTVDVEPGVVWDALARRLGKVGLDLCLCPTSGLSSTVGGWFAMGGVGIGSLRYGSIRDLVKEVDVVALDGEVRTVAGPELELYHQTCGTLGVVTRLKLACRRAEGVRCYAVAVRDAGGLEPLVRALERAEPYSMAIQSAGYLRMLGAAAEHAPPIEAGFLAVATFLGSSADDVAVARAVEASGARLLPAEVAEAEWDERFYPMRVKKLGPALLASEFMLPLSSFATALERIEARLARDLIGVEAFAVRGGRLAVLVYLLEDSRDRLFPVRMAKAMVPLRIALRHGGSIYSPALWLAFGTRRLFGEEKYRAVRAKKRLVDPQNLLNPGKLRAPRPRFLPLADLSTLIALGSTAIAPLARRLASRRSLTP